MLLPLFAALLIASTHVTVAASTTVVPIDPPGAKIRSVNKSLMLQLVNEVRRKGCQCGDTYYYPAPELTWNTKLEAAALSHSSNMQESNFFSHRAPDGSNGGVRIERAGYIWKAYGENIAAGYTSERAVLKGWLESPGHCKNLLNKRYREMGVARVGTYWTQEFGAQ